MKAKLIFSLVFTFTLFMSCKKVDLQPEKRGCDKHEDTTATTTGSSTTTGTSGTVPTLTGDSGIQEKLQIPAIHE